ncbi:hypothetical protein BV20DRAFT_1111908 [Pilatotrama ljubarskyi]|nr:hypothetical protein BV20DRAFT_1111908 [Pilatotrama ljubarskyi]
MPASSKGAETLTVSLEDHLADSLRPLLPLLPEQIATQLHSVLDPDPVPPLSSGKPSHTASPFHVRTIPYELLLAISKWSRTAEGEQALARHEPPLRAQDYSMVALLAGTRTSPDRNFPHAPVPGIGADSQAAHRRELSDRRAVTAVLNALLSIGGAALATYWAAGRLAWKDEWRVLLALSVAIVVASSEAILYLIWDSRRSNPERARVPRRQHSVSASPPVSPLYKKTESASPSEASGGSGTDDTSMRERVPAGKGEHPTHIRNQ